MRGTVSGERLDIESPAIKSGLEPTWSRNGTGWQERVAVPTEANIVIIGAGVVGLAVAAELAEIYPRIFVFERNRTFGLETSSHNSEVIHTGFYYPEKSLKARFCIEGNPLLYEICEKYNIGYRRLTKIVVAADDEETREIDRLYRQGLTNGITDLRLLSREEVKQLEPAVEAVAGLFSPSTGILDSWGLMQSFYGRAFEKGVSLVVDAEVVAIDKLSGGYRVSVKDREGISAVTTAVVINCAGLFCDKIASLAGIDVDKAGYRIHYCKGEYFSVSHRIGHPVSRLIYPVPEQAGKGIHISLSLDGGMKLGPSVKYVANIDYAVDESDKINFYKAAHKYLPLIQFDDLSPDFAGVRPKLQGPGDDFRDFVITDESERGLPGLIDLIGIESPGLTSSPAIARYVAGIVKPIL